MIQINQALQAKLAMLDGKDTYSYESRGRKYNRTWYYNEREERAWQSAFEWTLHRAAPETTVRTIGTWLWLSGPKASVRATLRACNNRYKFRFNEGRSKMAGPDNEVWYWRPAGTRGRYNPRRNLDELQDYYGGERATKRATE